jgi:hypothetical protein
MLLLLSIFLFGIGVLLLALSAALLALKIVLRIIMVVCRVLLWLLKEKAQPVEVEHAREVIGQEEAAITFTLTKNKDGTWVLK